MEIKITDISAESKYRLNVLSNFFKELALGINEEPQETIEPVVNNKFEQSDEFETPAVEKLDPLPSTNVVPDLDVRGIRWDKRIHASSRALTQKGTWRYVRGVSDQTINFVEKELLREGNHVSQPPAEAAAPNDEEPILTFPMLIKKVSGYIESGYITRSQFNHIIQKVGVASPPLLAGKPEKIPLVLAEVELLIEENRK